MFTRARQCRFSFWPDPKSELRPLRRFSCGDWVSIRFSGDDMRMDAVFLAEFPEVVAVAQRIKVAIADEKLVALRRMEIAG